MAALLRLVEPGYVIYIDTLDAFYARENPDKHDLLILDEADSTMLDPTSNFELVVANARCICLSATTGQSG